MECTRPPPSLLFVSCIPVTRSRFGSKQMATAITCMQQMAER